MPLYTPLGGSWLNLAEAIQRILKRRALAGQQPHSPAEIGAWFEQTAQAWNRQPTPFVWNGKRRQRRRRRPGNRHPLAVPQRTPSDLFRATGQAAKNTERHAK
jgi:hypothetical protein